jgi:hypothetical protein
MSFEKRRKLELFVDPSAAEIIYWQRLLTPKLASENGQVGPQFWTQVWASDVRRLSAVESVCPRELLVSRQWT